MKKQHIFLAAIALFAISQVFAQKKPNSIYTMSDDHTSQAVGV